MEQIVLLAAKSVVVAGATLLLLRLSRGRSAADRSLIAHLGLLALALLPLATLFLPALEVAAPAFLQPSAASEAAWPTAAAALPNLTATDIALNAEMAAVDQPIDWAFWIYLLPAAMLVLLTLIAVARLAVLKARANVLLDPHWLSALAQAQKRMDFKNGTALLTSDDLKSPISWGLLRPVILLNSNAVEAKAEAEAIIAHELAHVTRFDWAKLLLARIVVAFFWFNPLVWLLAREAHQLREEAADDAVLASDIADTDYAQLLVGIARHECRGLLIGAHGVAPGRTSLARRVTRVLDAASARAPAGWRWTSAAGFFAVAMAVPVAAMQLVAAAPADPDRQNWHNRSDAASSMAQVHTSDEHQAMPGEETHVQTSGIGPRPQELPPAEGTIQLVGSGGQTLTISGRQMAMVDARGRGITSNSIDRAIERKAVGATPEYVAAIKAANPRLRNISQQDIISLATLGVDPAYIRDLAAAGYDNLGPDDIAGARAIGITGDYARGMVRAGYKRVPMSQLIGMKVVGVSPADVEQFRRAGRGLPSVDQLVAMKTLGVGPKDLEDDPDP